MREAVCNAGGGGTKEGDRGGEAWARSRGKVNRCLEILGRGQGQG